MATDRQIAANRRNACKSTGPRTEKGRKRVAHNAYRHGLAASLPPDQEAAQEIDRRARAIAGDSKSSLKYAWGRAVAEAEYELARVRQAKIGYIALFAEVRGIHPPRAVQSLVDNGQSFLSRMPTEEPDSFAEALRCALPKLLKLDRYERRAMSKLHRAIRNVIGNAIKTVNRP
jgi:hypothetical protein